MCDWFKISLIGPKKVKCYLKNNISENLIKKFSDVKQHDGSYIFNKFDTGYIFFNNFPDTINIPKNWISRIEENLYDIVVFTGEN